MSDIERSEPKFELHYDHMSETYTIREVREIGPFDSREAAREWMINRVQS